MALCINCSENVDWLKFVKADVCMSNVSQGPSVDLILKCPHCDQEYNAFVPVEDFKPIGD